MDLNKIFEMQKHFHVGDVATLARWGDPHFYRILNVEKTVVLVEHEFCTFTGQEVLELETYPIGHDKGYDYIEIDCGGLISRIYPDDTDRGWK